MENLSIPIQVLKTCGAESIVVKEMLLVIIINVSVIVSIVLPMLMVIYLLMR